LVLLILLSGKTFAAPCDLQQEHPHQGFFTLSNDTQVAVPTHATDLDTYILYAWLDYEKTADLLAKEGLYPLSVGGKAIGAISVFDYKISDLGSFRESYFAILATSKPLNPIAGFFAALRLLRINPQGPTRDITLYHQLAWSNSENARLASEEIWGIPSTFASISISPLKFSVKSVFDLTWRKTPEIENPLGHEIFLYATGPKRPEQSWSPVKACGESHFTTFSGDRGDSFVAHDFGLYWLLRHLEFKPFVKEFADGQQAAQFLPDPKT
jgi:hypothetical protein